VVWYPTPGLKKVSQTPNGKPIRGMYRATNGDLYIAAGFDIYFVDAKYTWKHIGAIKTTKTLHPIKFSDNGVSVVLCDGTPANGNAIHMATHSGLDPLYDPSKGDALTDASIGWLGSNYLDYSDGFIIANSLGTPSWYISNPNDTIFDPLQFSAKTASPDVLVAALALHRVIWLIGTISSEVWYLTGGGGVGSPNNFPYESMPGAVIDFGCNAPYSVAKADSAIFWLAQNSTGETVVMEGSGYKAQRISNHGLEFQFSTYATVSDAIGYTYMANGHTFYVLNFPTADVTWMYDRSTQHWSQLVAIDANGNEHAHHSTMHAFAYDKHFANDSRNGNLYELSFSTYTDDGQPIKRVLGFPRQIEPKGDHRLIFRDFIAELDAGQTVNPNANSLIALRWSDDKGETWSNAMFQSLGRVGQFNKFVKWQRLGLSRNRVFRLEWSVDAFVAVAGAFTDVIPAAA